MAWGGGHRGAESTEFPLWFVPTALCFLLVMPGVFIINQ